MYYSLTSKLKRKRKSIIM